MNKYNPDAKCCKCGGGDIEDVHEDARIPSEQVRRMSAAFGLPKPDSIPERIAHTCKNCGYLWHELPMDDSDVSDA